MNIADLAEKLATDHDLPKNKAKLLLEATFAAVGDAIASGEEVSIQGFGKFKVSDRPAREGRNPATGETIQIAASRKAAFAPAKPLKEKLNGAEA
jgi:DNA-binding protein HU-beta